MYKHTFFLSNILLLEIAIERVFFFFLFGKCYENTVWNFSTLVLTFTEDY